MCTVAVECVQYLDGECLCKQPHTDCYCFHPTQARDTSQFSQYFLLDFIWGYWSFGVSSHLTSNIWCAVPWIEKWLFVFNWSWEPPFTVQYSMIGTGTVGWFLGDNYWGLGDWCCWGQEISIISPSWGPVMGVWMAIGQMGQKSVRMCQTLVFSFILLASYGSALKVSAHWWVYQGVGPEKPFCMRKTIFL